MYIVAVDQIEDNNQRERSCDEFISRLTVHYDQRNYLLHFREGNGRVQQLQ